MKRLTVLVLGMVTLSASLVIAQDDGQRQPITSQTADWLEASLVLEGAADGAADVAFSPDGTLLASGGSGGVLVLWDATIGEQVAVLPDAAEDPLPTVMRLAYSPGDALAVSGDAGGAVRLWEVPAGGVASTLAGGSAVTSLAFSPDGSLLAVGRGDGAVEIWDVAAADRVAAFEGHAGEVTSVTFLGESDTLVSGGADGAILLWDGQRAEPQGEVVGGDAAVLDLAASADGALLAAVRGDGAVWLWNVSSGELPAMLQHAEEGDMICAVFVPGERLLAAGTTGGSLTLWNGDSGALLVVLHGHDAPVTGLDINAGGNQLATRGADGMIRLWRVPPQAEGTLVGNPAAGAVLFVETGCTDCHASEPGGSETGPAVEAMAREAGARVPGLTAGAYLTLSITQPHTTIVKGFPTLMPTFVLTEQEVADLVAYIQTFR